MYLDRYHVKQQSLPSLHEAALRAFKTVVFDQIKQPFFEAVLNLIERDREGETVDGDLLRDCVVVFCKMGANLEYYKSELEAPFLEASREFYNKRSQEWIGTDSTPTYLIKAEIALAEEENRVNRFLEGATLPKLTEVCRIELLEVHENTLLNKEGASRDIKMFRH